MDWLHFRRFLWNYVLIYSSRHQRQTVSAVIVLLIFIHLLFANYPSTHTRDPQVVMNMKADFAQSENLPKAPEQNSIPVWGKTHWVSLEFDAFEINSADLK